MSTNTDAESKVWQVKFASGEVRPMTLTQLDDAFQNSVVNAETYVLEGGTTTWAKLGEVAGIQITGESKVAPAPVSEIPVALPDFREGVPRDSRGLDDLDDEMAAGFRPGKRGPILWMIAAAVLVGGAGFAATRSSDKPQVPVAVAAPPPPAATPIPPVPVVSPAPAEAPPPKVDASPPLAQGTKTAKNRDASSKAKVAPSRKAKSAKPSKAR